MRTLEEQAHDWRTVNWRNRTEAYERLYPELNGLGLDMWQAAIRLRDRASDEGDRSRARYSRRALAKLLHDTSLQTFEHLCRAERAEREAMYQESAA